MILQILIFILLAVAVLGSTVAGIWFLIEAFRVHILWGLALLVFPVLGAVFLFLHWDDVRKPFLLNMIAVSLFLAAFALTLYGGNSAENAQSGPETPSFSISEKIAEIKQASVERKAREAIATRGFMGRTLDDVEQELGPPQARMTRDNLVEYQYTDRGLTLISSNGITVTDEIRR
ncbi:MAG: hypothetical protein PHG65_08460 [Kiritimatiellae bacterium]|nr:hypothetical protein [Kiritimatiellia bacterium]